MIENYKKAYHVNQYDKSILAKLLEHKVCATNCIVCNIDIADIYNNFKPTNIKNFYDSAKCSNC